MVGAVVGGWKELSGLVEEGIRKVDSQRKNHRTSHSQLCIVCRAQTDEFVAMVVGLFGVDIKELTKHEGVESKHGIDPNAKGFKVPEFLDHILTALKQSGRLHLSIYSLSQFSELIDLDEACRSFSFWNLAKISELTETRTNHRSTRVCLPLSSSHISLTPLDPCLVTQMVQTRRF